NIERVFNNFNFPGEDDLYAAVVYQGLTSALVVTRLTQLLRKEQENEKNNQEQIEDVKTPVQEKRVNNNKTDSGVVVEGVDNVLVRLSRCCNPVPNDDIVGFITKGRGVSVHRRDCPNVHFNQDQERFIDVFWKSSTHSSKEYHLDMEISGYDRNGLLNEVL